MIAMATIYDTVVHQMEQFEIQLQEILDLFQLGIHLSDIASFQGSSETQTQMQTQSVSPGVRIVFIHSPFFDQVELLFMQSARWNTFISSLRIFTASANLNTHSAHVRGQFATNVLFPGILAIQRIICKMLTGLQNT